jgi:hypothetical protein
VTVAPAAWACAMTSSTSGRLATTWPMLNSPGFAGKGLAPWELGPDQPFGLEAQPVAVERQGAVEVGYCEGDDMDARLHGRFLLVWPVVLQSMIGARD